MLLGAGRVALPDPAREIDDDADECVSATFNLRGPADRDIEAREAGRSTVDVDLDARAVDEAARLVAVDLETKRARKRCDEGRLRSNVAAAGGERHEGGLAEVHRLPAGEREPALRLPERMRADRLYPLPKHARAYTGKIGVTLACARKF